MAVEDRKSVEIAQLDKDSVMAGIAPLDKDSAAEIVPLDRDSAMADIAPLDKDSEVLKIVPLGRDSEVAQIVLSNSAEDTDWVVTARVEMATGTMLVTAEPTYSPALTRGSHRLLPPPCQVGKTRSRHACLH